MDSAGQKESRPMRALRIDDLGASSKAYEQWSRTRWANVGPFKAHWPWKAMGPYRELRADELNRICGMVAEADSRITLAITSAWNDGRWWLGEDPIPYRFKFPAQAEVVKRWAERGIVEVANHGWTHTTRRHIRPRFWRGNRDAHREFTDAEPADGGNNALIWSQEDFVRWLGSLAPTILVPPGFVFHEKFQPCAGRLGLRVWRKDEDARVLALHDRDFVLGDGFNELRRQLACSRFVACGDLDAP